MNRPTHTPEDWTLKQLRDVFRVGCGSRASEAQLHLFAAAPAMLEALREMMREYEPTNPESAPDAVILARAALALAQKGLEEKPEAIPEALNAIRYALGYELPPTVAIRFRAALALAAKGGEGE